MWWNWFRTTKGTEVRVAQPPQDIATEQEIARRVTEGLALTVEKTNSTAQQLDVDDRDRAGAQRPSGYGHTPRKTLSSGWIEQWRSKCESPAEVAFLEALIDGFELRPAASLLRGGISLALQYQIGSSRVDFLINQNLVVEVDGHAYHSSPQQAKRDASRDAMLRSSGYKVLRITAHRVFSAPEAAVADVRDAL